MSQISILAVDISQNADSKGISEIGSVNQQSGSSSFSDVMAQQQQAKGGKNSLSGGKDSQTQMNTVQRSDSSVKQETVSDDEQNMQQTSNEAKVSTDEKNANSSSEQQLSASDKEATSQQNASEERVLDETIIEPITKDQRTDIAKELLSFIAAAEEVSTEHGDNKPSVEKTDGAYSFNVTANKVMSAADLIATEAVEEISDNAEQEASGNNPLLKQSIQLNSDGNTKANNNQAELAQKLAQQASASTADKSENQVNALDQVKALDSAIINSEQVAVELNGEQQTSEQDIQVIKTAINQSSLATNVNSVAEQLNIDGASDEPGEHQNELTAEQVSALQAAAGASEKPTTEQASNDNSAKTVSIDTAQLNAANINASVGQDNQQQEFVDNDNNEIKSDVILTASNVADSKVVDNKTSNNPAERIINQATTSVTTEQSQTAQQEQSSQQESSNAKNLVQEQLVQEKQNLDLEQGNEKVNAAIVDAARTTKTLASEGATQAITQHQVTFEQEQAIQHSVAKANADVSVQSAKAAMNIHNETIAIYRKDFSDAVKEKVMVMINQKIKQLEIRLDPPELGSMHVKLNLQNEQAAVHFVVQNQQAKDALEQNLGRLKEMLADSGVDVGDANIEQRDPQSQAQEGFAQHQGQGGGFEGEENDFTQGAAMMSGANLYKASATGVDYYA